MILQCALLSRVDVMPLDEANRHAGVSDVMRPFRPTSAGLTYRCAESIDDVLIAWHLVYSAYRRREIIGPSHHQIYTAQSAVTPQSLVLLGQIGPVTVSTLTATVQCPVGLAAGLVSNAQNDTLRGPGRRVLEFHLYADRRGDDGRATDAMLHLMALGWAWGEEHRATDCVMAVEPARVSYFRHAFGFEPVGERRWKKSAPRSPLIMMWCDIAHCLSLGSPPIGLRFLMAQAPGAGTAARSRAFDRRYAFEPGEVARSPIGDFLSEKYVARAAG